MVDLRFVGNDPADAPRIGGLDARLAREVSRQSRSRQTTS